jgi:hypothetical protein
MRNKGVRAVVQKRVSSMPIEPVILSLILLISAGIMDGQDRGVAAAPGPADPSSPPGTWEVTPPPQAFSRL